MPGAAAVARKGESGDANHILRVYSHLSCLVRLNQTQASFPLWCGSFGQVWIQQSHSGADQTTVLRRWRGVTVRFQMNSGTVEWMNQWMDDLKHTCGFVSGSLAKRAVWKWTTPNKKNQYCIWSRPKQVTSCCEYTLRWILEGLNIVSVSNMEPNFIYLNLMLLSSRRCEEKSIVGWRHLAYRCELANDDQSFHAQCESTVRLWFVSLFHIALSVKQPSDCFLKEHVTVKTGIMMLKIQLYHHRNKLTF